jgi:hypothetical protein
MFLGATRDRGGEKKNWVICSDVGGRSYLSRFYYPEKSSDLRHVFCANLDLAIRFASLGELMEVMATIPEYLEAYEDDPRFINRHRI